MDKKDIKFSENLFWDIDVEKLDIDRYPAFVIQRVLEYGSWEDWVQIRSYYSIQTIKEEVMNLRTLNPKVLHYIALYTNTDIKDYRCYKLTQSHQTHWHY